MTIKILDGKKVRDERLHGLKDRFATMRPKPTLVIIQVGHRADSTAYIRAKITFAEKVGITVNHIHVPEDVQEMVLIRHIEVCNTDTQVKGIIIQLPLPSHLNRDRIINTIDPRKDVDGLTEANVSKMEHNDPSAIIPATARGVMDILEYYKIPIAKKRVTVVGRSALVGKPIAQLLRNKGAEVTVAHSKTTDLAAETTKADILIVAVGKIGLIRAEHVRSGQVIIDVGINTIQGEKLEEEVGRRTLVGDVDTEAVKDIVAAITPVPGGVGPMTVCALFENLADMS